MIETKTTNLLTRTKLILDVTIFIAFLVAMEPRSSGVTIHEWLATAALAAIVFHLLLSWDWIIQVSQRFVSAMNLQTRINYIINWLVFFDVTILMLSGFMISRSVLPSLGIKLPENFAWRGLHEFTANFFIILLGIHTALHWNWIVNTFKKYVFQPLGKLFASKKNKEMAA